MVALTSLTRRIAARERRRGANVLPERAWNPTPAQERFLALDAQWALFGGQAAGGKSVALAFALSQHVDQAHYRALGIAQTDKVLRAAGGLIDALASIYPALDISSGADVIRFPSGARIHFVTLPHTKAHERIRGTTYHTIAVDEAGLVTPYQLGWLPRSLRRAPDDPIPLRYRLTANPGGVGQGWLRRIFVEGNIDDSAPSVAFLPASVDDNPHIDSEEYRRQFAHMDALERARMLSGDWYAAPESLFAEGAMAAFSGEIGYDRAVRSWDLAASDSEYSDYSVGVLVGEKDGIYYIDDMNRFRAKPAGVENLLAATAEKDGADVEIVIEQTPGGSGLALVDHYERNVLPDFSVSGYRPTGDKVDRARVLSGLIGEGRVRLRQNMAGRGDMLDEMRSFPDGEHDDIVDALSQAMIFLEEGGAYSGLDAYYRDL